MSPIRGFSSSQGLNPAVRNIDSDAPNQMRQELVDVIFHICENNRGYINISPRHIYQVSSQSIGVTASGSPAQGYRHAVGRYLGRVDWQRVYDLIVRLWPEFQGENLEGEYREGVNRVLAGHGIVWELDETGKLIRVLPSAAQGQVDAAIQELSQARFQAASILFNDARDAYDDRPRRDCDACSNVFKAMESVAKVIFNMPSATFGSVLGHVRSTGVLRSEIITVLESINTLRNHKFGHGMQTPFALSAPEVDFTYLTCIGGILLFARI